MLHVPQYVSSLASQSVSILWVIWLNETIIASISKYNGQTLVGLSRLNVLKIAANTLKNGKNLFPSAILWKGAGISVLCYASFTT